MLSTTQIHNDSRQHKHFLLPGAEQRQEGLEHGVCPPCNSKCRVFSRRPWQHPQLISEANHNAKSCQALAFSWQVRHMQGKGLLCVLKRLAQLKNSPLMEEAAHHWDYLTDHYDFGCPKQDKNVSSSHF